MVAYISQNADSKIITALEQEGFDIIPLAPFSALKNPVSSHADMLLLTVADTVFVHKDYNIDLHSFKNVIKIDEPISNKYPNDILLNIAIVGKNVFANTKFASKIVLEHLKANEFTVHHVSQGYAHCSTCIVDDNAIITSDVGIAGAAEKAGIDVLRIKQGHISLPPYDYGFIGGASGVHGEKIYFAGSLKSHPDGDKIRDFCLNHGKKVMELSDAPLHDIGGILIR